MSSLVVGLKHNIILDANPLISVDEAAFASPLRSPLDKEREPGLCICICMLWRLPRVYIESDTSGTLHIRMYVLYYTYTPGAASPLCPDVPVPSAAPCEFSAVDTLRNDVLHYYNIVGMGPTIRWCSATAKCISAGDMSVSGVCARVPSTLLSISLPSISHQARIEGLHYVFMRTLRSHLFQTIDVSFTVKVCRVTLVVVHVSPVVNMSVHLQRHKPQENLRCSLLLKSLGQDR